MNSYLPVDFSTHTANTSYGPSIGTEKVPEVSGDSFETYLRSLNEGGPAEMSGTPRDGGKANDSYSKSGVDRKTDDNEYAKKEISKSSSNSSDSSSNTSDAVENRKSEGLDKSEKNRKEDTVKVPENDEQGREKGEKKTHLKGLDREAAEELDSNSSIKNLKEKTGKIGNGEETAEKTGDNAGRENEIVVDIRGKQSQEELLTPSSLNGENTAGKKQSFAEEKNSGSSNIHSSRAEGLSQVKNAFLRSSESAGGDGSNNGKGDQQNPESGEKGPKLFVIDQRGKENGKTERGAISERIELDGKNSNKNALSAAEEDSLFQKNGMKSDSLAKTNEGEDISFFRNVGGKDGQSESLSGKQSDVFVSLKERQQLLQQLKDKGNQAIVKQTGFILKKDSSGEIRLVLKPERLGNVKIRINLEDNNIAGKIIVENNTVRDIFEQNLENLYRSLRENGFQNAQLEVSVGNGKNGKGNQKQDTGKGRSQGVGILEENLGIEEGTGFFGDYTIDLVV